MKILISILCLIPTLCFGQGFGSFRTDQPFLSNDESHAYSLLFGIIAYWPMESGDGNDQADSVGSYTLSNLASVSSTNSGLIGKAALWPSSAAAGTRLANGDAVFRGTNSFTLSGWWYLESTADQKQFVTRYQSTGVGPWLFGNGQSTTTVRFRVTAADGTVITRNYIERADFQNTWTHIALGYNSTNAIFWLATNSVMVIYEDLSSYGGLTNYVGLNLTFGNYSDNGGYPNLGRIDECGYWDRQLTTNELQELYNSGSGLAYPF